MAVYGVSWYIIDLRIFGLNDYRTTHPGSGQASNVIFGSSLGSGRDDYHSKLHLPLYFYHLILSHTIKIVHNVRRTNLQKVCPNMPVALLIPSISGVSVIDGNVNVQRWRNQDKGGTMVKGDGSRYCDMTGSGSDDYIVRASYTT